MRSIKAKMAALTIAAAMLLTACGDIEGAYSFESKRKRNKSSYSNNTDAGDSGNSGTGNSGDIDMGNLGNIGTGDSGNLPPEEPVKKLGMWDVLPEIPVTDASAFKYEYDSKLALEIDRETWNLIELLRKQYTYQLMGKIPKYFVEIQSTCSQICEFY